MTNWGNLQNYPNLCNLGQTSKPLQILPKLCKKPLQIFSPICHGQMKQNMILGCLKNVKKP